MDAIKNRTEAYCI